VNRIEKGESISDHTENVSDKIGENIRKCREGMRGLTAPESRIEQSSVGAESQ